MGLAQKTLNRAANVNKTDLTGVKRCQLFCLSRELLRGEELLNALQRDEIRCDQHVRSPFFSTMNMNDFRQWLIDIGYDDPNKDARFHYEMKDLLNYMVAIQKWN